MNNKFDGYEEFDLAAKNLRAQCTSAKDVSDYYELRERVKASNEAREQAMRERDNNALALQQEHLRTIKASNEAHELALRERDRVEAIRYRETRTLSVIAIGIAVISVVISIFK